MCDDLEFLSSKNIKKLRLTKLDILKRRESNEIIKFENR